MLETESEKERKAIRSGYEYAQILAEAVAETFPQGDKIDIRKEIRWQVEQLSDDPQERRELLPYVTYGFRQGTVDRLYGGMSRYEV